MSRVAKDLTGTRFGRLVVVGREGQTKSGNAKWFCRCDCGGEAVSQSFHLRSGQTRSCGCIKSEQRLVLLKTHGMSRSPTWNSWDSMIARCTRETHRSYSRYGGRGIKICDRWLESFENFFADMGGRPEGRTLDRKDNDGNYEPENCRWATHLEQSLNRGNYNIRVLHEGKDVTVKRYAEVSGMHIQTIYRKLKEGVL